MKALLIYTALALATTLCAAQEHPEGQDPSETDLSALRAAVDALRQELHRATEQVRRLETKLEQQLKQEAESEFILERLIEIQRVSQPAERLPEQRAQHPPEARSVVEPDSVSREAGALRQEVVALQQRVQELQLKGADLELQSQRLAEVNRLIEERIEQLNKQLRGQLRGDGLN